jgi:hypothetical protein
MFVEFNDAARKVWVNPLQVRYVRPCWSSTDKFPRTDLVFGNELNWLSSLLWFVFPSPIKTVDGTVDSIVQRLNEAMPQLC